MSCQNALQNSTFAFFMMCAIFLALMSGSIKYLVLVNRDLAAWPSEFDKELGLWTGKPNVNLLDEADADEEEDQLLREPAKDMLSLVLGLSCSLATFDWLDGWVEVEDGGQKFAKMRSLFVNVSYPSL